MHLSYINSWFYLVFGCGDTSKINICTKCQVHFCTSKQENILVFVAYYNKVLSVYALYTTSGAFEV